MFLTEKNIHTIKKSNAQVKYLLCVASQNSVNENRKITKQVTYQNFVTITDATHKDTYISLLLFHFVDQCDHTPLLLPIKVTNALTNGAAEVAN